MEANRARYEQALGNAGQWAFRATEAANALGLQGAEEDCRMLHNEIARLLTDSINGRRRPLRRNAQLDLHPGRS